MLNVNREIIKERNAIFYKLLLILAVSSVMTCVVNSTTDMSEDYETVISIILCQCNFLLGYKLLLKEHISRLSKLKVFENAGMPEIDEEVFAELDEKDSQKR